jgi:hypothetical protein
MGGPKTNSTKPSIFVAALSAAVPFLDVLREERHKEKNAV